MYKNILVSLSLEHGYGKMALNLARKLKAPDGNITVVHVFEPIHAPVSLYVQDEDIMKVQKSAKEKLAERIGDIKGVETVTLNGNAARAITDYAERMGVDCIIVGSHKPGLQDYFIGSTAARIVRHAKCAVHVLREA